VQQLLLQLPDITTSHCFRLHSARQYHTRHVISAHFMTSRSARLSDVRQFNVTCVTCDNVTRVTSDTWQLCRRRNSLVHVTVFRRLTVNYRRSSYDSHS